MDLPQLTPFEESDRTSLLELGREIVDEGSVFPFEHVAGVERYWFRDDATVVVARRAGRVVGTYSMHPNQEDRGAHVANAGYMVAASERGRGLGRSLGEHSIRTATQMGFRALQYNFVVATNGAAVRLWKRLGFSEIGRVPGAFRHPQLGYVDVLILHRPLTA